MSALSAVAIPAAAVTPIVSTAHADAQASTEFASVLDSLPHTATKSASGAVNSEGSGEGDQSKARRSAAEDRANLESAALALSLPTAGPSASPAALVEQTSIGSVATANAHVAGAAKAAMGNESDGATAPTWGSAKIAGAKLIGDRAFHAAPSPLTATIPAGTTPPEAKASQSAVPRTTMREDALDAETVGQQHRSAPGSNETAGKPSLVVEDSFAPDATKAAAGANTPHQDLASGKPASHQDRQTSRSAAMKYFPAIVVSREPTSSVTTAGRSPYWGKMSAPHEPARAASRETSKSMPDALTLAAAADASQPNPASTIATPTAPLDTGLIAAAAASLSQITFSESPAASTSQTADTPPKSIPASTPVREIDMDLAPGGLEHVSMTMRLAGDRLSVVIRAGSGRTAGALETAREAITERLAAIGQPLASLVIQQTGANTGETPYAKDSSHGKDWPQGQSSKANDQRGDRPGGASDRR